MRLTGRPGRRTDQRVRLAVAFLLLAACGGRAEVDTVKPEVSSAEECLGAADAQRDLADCDEVTYLLCERQDTGELFEQPYCAD